MATQNQIQHLRFLGGRKIGGIIIAFTDVDHKDSYGNYWTKETDLCIQRYNRRPLYFQHRGDMVEAGYIENENLRITSKGLYMEVETLDNDAGKACLRFVSEGRGYYSTGVMPGSWIEDSDGYVRQWPFVEASITDRPATRDGLTRASHVRSLVGDEVDQNVPLRRGPIMEENQTGGNGAAPAPAVPSVTPSAADFSSLIQQFRGVVREEMAANQPATRSLPAGGFVPVSAAPAAANIQVSHIYDDISLPVMAIWGQLRLEHGNLRGDKETEFMRALVAKMEKQRSKDDALPERDVMRGAVRMIDYEVYDHWADKGRGHIRANEAMTSTYDGYGDQLVPTLMSSIVWYHMMMESKVVSMLPKIKLPSVPYDHPIITGGPAIRKVPQLTDQANFSVHASKIPASKITTGKVTFTPGEIGALVLAEQTLFEDSAIDIAKMWVTQMLRQMVAGIDHVVINGDEDTGNTNISHLGAAPADTDYDKILICEGLRSMAFTNSDTVAVATLATTSLTALRKLMGARGKFGLNPKELVWILDPGSYYKLLDLEALDSVADVGEYATLLTGAVGQLGGVPVVVSDEMENTDANGKIPSTHDATKGSQVCLRTQGVHFGYARDVNTEFAKIPGTGGYFADITVRFDVQEEQAGQVAYGFNTTI